MMNVERSKNKIKIQINKALQTVNSIVKPTSDIRQQLHQTYRDITPEKGEQIHSTIKDQETGQEFIISDYNRDGTTQNYRSPYSGRYSPIHREEATVLSPLLRDLEDKGNLLFSEYARMYYGPEGVLGNFYVFQTEEGLNFAFLLKKLYKDKDMFGVWCSTNFVEIRGDPAKSVSYKLQTTVLYELNMLNETTQELVEVHGSTKKHRVESKRWSPEYELDDFHLVMSGKLIEEVETQLLQQIQSVFVKKTKEILFKTRFEHTKQVQSQRQQRGKELAKIRAESVRVVQL